MTWVIPRWSLLTLLIGVVGAIVWHGWDLTRWAYADWVAVSAESRQALTWSGPWAAGCAAWIAGTFANPRGVIAPFTATRRGTPLAAWQVAQLVATSWAGMLVALVPLWVWTMTEAVYGQPNLLVIVGGFCGLAAFVSLGYLIGAVLPRLLGAPVGIAVGFVAVAAAGLNGRPTSPVWPFGVVEGLEEVTTVGAFRVVFFLGISAAFVIGSGWWLRERRLSVTPAAVVGVGLALAPVLVVAGLANRSAPNLIRQAPASAQCSDGRGGINVCLHPAREELLGPLTDRVSKIVSALGGGGLPFAGVSDATLWQERSDVLSLQMQIGSDAWLDVAVNDIALVASGALNCGQQAVGLADRPEGLVVADGLAIWIAAQGGSSLPLTSDPEALAVADDLAEMPGPERSQMFASSLGLIRSCQATREDLR